MKPKNRVMCPDCGRQKLLFETEKKAETFIKFNGNELSDNPDKLRVYYCPACCGYHISSKPFYNGYEGRTERMLERYYRDKKTVFDILVAHDPENEEEIKKVLKGISGHTSSEAELGVKKYKKYKGIK